MDGSGGRRGGAEFTGGHWALGAGMLLLVVLSSCLSLGPYAIQDAFIGHADQANMAGLARNIAEGRGAVVDTVWIIADGGVRSPQGSPPGAITGPEPYWSVYVAAVLAPFFFLFGSSRLVLVLPALLAKLAIAFLAAYWVLRLCRDYRPAAVTAVILLLEPIMLAQVNGLSDVYFSLLVLVCGTCLALGAARERSGVLFLAGVAMGAAVAVKPSGVLLLGFLPLYVLSKPRASLRQAKLAAILAGLGLGLLP